MRHLVSRVLIASLLLLTVAIPGVFFAQDGASISVTPDSGVIGSAVFQVDVSGLTPEETYTIEFVLDGLVVFASDEEANANGNVIFSAASTEDDEAGTYTVQVISNNSIIASTEFELMVESDVPEDTAEPDDEDTSDDTPVEEIGSLSVTPPSGPINTVHTIRIRDLDPDTPYTIEITASDTESVVYRRLWSSDDVGSIDIEIFAEEGDTPGQQVVRVFNNDGDVVAQGDFTIEAPPERNPSAEITPLVAPAGREFTITVTGLASFDSVSAEIIAEDNMLVDTVFARASSEGVAILSYLSDDELEDGTYTVTVYVDDEELTQSTLTIGDVPPAGTEDDPTATPDDGDSDATATPDDSESASSSSAVLTIDPEVGLLGETHVMTVTGLEANQAITLTIFNRDGEIEYTTTREADENGEFTINISSSEEDEIGGYPVEITDATTGELLADGALVIAEMTDSSEDTPDQPEQTGTASISVTPETGDIGTTFAVMLSGMPADTRIGVTVRYTSDDTLAQSSVVSIGSDGTAELEFASSDLDTPGDYTIVAILPDGERASATFTIEGALATIEPASGVVGTSHLITVTGLNPDETVTYNVMFDGETVFSADETADADGVSTLSLATEEGDEPGDYTIMVERESGNEPTVTLTVTEEEVVEETPEDTADDTEDTTDESADTEDDTETETEDTTEDTPDDTTQQPAESAPAQVFEDIVPSSGTASLTFSGEAGQYILVRVESDAFDTAAAIYDNDFLELGYNDDAVNTTNSLIGPVRLPYTGTYSLEVFTSFFDDSANGQPFTATIMPIDVSDVAVNEPTPFSVSADMPNAYFAIEVEAGDSINVMGNTSGTLDTVIRVLDPDGFEVAYDDDGGADLEAEITNLLIDYDGTYLVEISTFTPEVEGQGTVTISRNPVKSLEDGTVTITLNDKTYRDVVVFDAFAGELVTLNLETVSGSVEDLYVYALVDGMQVMTYSTMGIPSNLPLTFVMPMDGEVVVTFEEFGFGQGITLDVSVTKSRRN